MNFSRYFIDQPILGDSKMKALLMTFVVAFLAVACSGGGGGDGGGGVSPSTPVATIEVAPASLTLRAGDVIQLAAVPRDAQGAVLGGKTIAWSSADGSKVAVTADGRARALGPGATSVTATTEGKSASAQIVVIERQAAVERVALNAVAERLEEGARLQLVATAYDAAGEVVNGRGVRWASSDVGAVSVEVDGVVTALRPGVVSVTATVDGRSAAATITVFAAYDFDLLFSAADVGAPDELLALDISDPVAVALPVFPRGRPASHAAPSPDGRRIAFVVHGEWNGSHWQSMIFVANRDGSDARRLTDRPARNTEPAWSPDGTMLAFTSQIFGEQADIWVVNEDGSNASNITADQPSASKRSPAWSPVLSNGGHRIAYSLEAGGTSLIWTMLADGADKRPVTTEPHFFDSEPAWSPDGATLVFQRTGVATFGDLYLVSSTGGLARALLRGTPLAHGQFGPAWSPDGRLIAFSSKHADGERYQVWTVWADGSRLAQRTTEIRNHADAVWRVRR